MFKRLFTVLAFCAVLTGQQMNSTGGSTSTGGALLSAPLGTLHSISPSDTATLADAVVPSKHIQLAAIADSIGASPAVSVHKIVVVRNNESLGADPQLSIHRKILLAAAQGATVTDAPVVTHSAIYRPTTFVDNGFNQNEIQALCVNDNLAYDGVLSTANDCTAFLNILNGNFTIKNVVWFGFSASAGGFSSLTLNVKSSGIVSAECTSSVNGMSYSLDNGSSYLSILQQQGTYGTRTDQISLPLTQDLTKIKVQTHAECDTGTSSHSTVIETVAEIWIQAQ